MATKLGRTQITLAVLTDGRDGVDGKDGTSVTITAKDVQYAISTSGTEKPSSWSGSIVPEKGKYLWTWMHVEYSDGDKTDVYSVGYVGTDGAAGKNGLGMYRSMTVLSVSSTSVALSTIATKPNRDWQTGDMIMDTNGLGFAVTANTSISASTIPIGYRFTLKGSKGDAGKGIASIVEKYAKSTSNTEVPTSWDTSVPTLNSNERFLWNYEEITYTDNTSSTTAKRVIGVYGDKGDTGATGKGITAINNFYLATSASTGVTISTSGWTPTVQVVTADKKYLWNYEQITYTEGEPTTSTPCIIGTYGDKGDDGSSITTSVEYLLSTSSDLTEDEQALATGWVQEELVTWSYGKYIYKRIKTYNHTTATATYTYSGRDTEVEDHFKGQLRFELSADRTTYIINKRSTGVNTITFRINQQFYAPTSYVWTKNGESFTPTRVASSDSYTYEIPVTGDPSVLEIKVVPYLGDTEIEGVSSTVILSPDNQTEYYQFLGELTVAPTATEGYLAGDSCFVSGENCIYVFNGSSWQTFATSTLNDETKITVLAKAEKTAFEYAETHDLCQDYGYFSTLFTKYVYARNIGAETIELTGTKGKLVGGDYETLTGVTSDCEGYLANKGVYIDSTGLARFTLALLNNCKIQGGTINVLTVEGDLRNNVLKTTQKEVAGNALSVGSMASQNYYLGSQAKSKIKALLPAADTLYSYSGTYGGKSFTKIINLLGKTPLPVALRYNLQSSTQTGMRTRGYTYVFGPNIVLRYDSSYNELEVSTDNMQTWTSTGSSGPFYDNSRSFYKDLALTYFDDGFYGYVNCPSDHKNYKKLMKSTDGVNWTSLGTYTFGSPNTLANTQLIAVGSNLYLTQRGYVYRLQSSSWSTVAERYTDSNAFLAYLTSAGFFSRDSSYNWKYRIADSTSTISTPSNTTAMWYSGGYAFAYAGTTIYATSWDPSTPSTSPTWTSLATWSTYSETALGRTNTIWAYYDSSSLTAYIYNGTSLLKTITYTDSSTAPDTWNNNYYKNENLYAYNSVSTSATLYKYTAVQRSWSTGLNFLNSSNDVVAYESEMGDYMQSQACTLNNGSTALLSLPSTIPSGMDYYRKIPTLFSVTQVMLSISKINIEAYTRFDTSTNAEVYMSAVTTKPSRVDVSPTSMMVDGVEKLNSTWYIKNKTSLTASVTPNSESAGVKTGNIDAMASGTYTIGAVTPYKSISATTFVGSLSGNATTATTATKANALSGFTARSSGTWGNQTGTFIHGEDDPAGGSFLFRKNCPNNGQVSMMIDGRFYQNEGKYPCIDSSGGTISGTLYVTQLNASGTSNKVYGAVFN